jgi:hypothetical protein
VSCRRVKSGETEDTPGDGLQPGDVVVRAKASTQLGEDSGLGSPVAIDPKPDVSKFDQSGIALQSYDSPMVRRRSRVASSHSAPASPAS